jgi:hypothetical protein
MWVRFKGNFPNVPVDDIAVHPRENDLIFGTHGRSIWILDDINPLMQLTKEVLTSPAFLFDIRKAMMFNPYNHKGSLGQKYFVAPNPPFGALISYYLKEEAKGGVDIIIKDSAGKQIAGLKGTNNAGINRITWNLRYIPPEPEDEEAASRRFRVRGPFVLPGEYSVTLKTARQEMTKTVEVEGDPRIDVSFADRKAQHDALLIVYELTPLMSTATRTLSSIKGEIQRVRGDLSKVPDAPEIVVEEIKAVSKKLDDIQVKLAGDPRLGWRGMRASVRGRLSMVGRAIGGFTGAPSEQQVQQLRKESVELKTLIERINTIIEVDVPKLNKLMNENNIPRIFVGRIIKIKD